MRNSRAVQYCQVKSNIKSCKGYVIPDFYPVTDEMLAELQPRQLEIMEARQTAYIDTVYKLSVIQALLILAALFTGVSMGAIISYIRYVGCGAESRAKKMKDSPELKL